jgi:L-amino acid N-acyltransferase YncA
MITVRVAEEGDAASFLEIYAPYIHTSAATFENEVPTAQEFAERIQKVLRRFPWLVAEVNEQIAGYVYASPHRDRAAYQWTCECSVYVHEAFKKLGIGSALYGALFGILQRQGMRNVYAGITLPNEASVRLHERLGFTHFATYAHVGYKLGRWHDVGWWQLEVNQVSGAPQVPVPFAAMPQDAYADLVQEAKETITGRLAR